MAIKDTPLGSVMSRPKVVFFGNEKLATGLPATKPIIQDALRAAGFEIELTVTGPLSELKLHESKLAVLAAYGHIIPQRALDEFPMGVINIHPSLLPKYRGPTPIESAILDGVTKTGVSIMRLTAGMDEGPVYEQKAIHLTGNETKAELAEVLQKLGAELLVEVLPAIADGSLSPRQQSHPDRDATYCKKISKEDGRIDWNKPAEQIEREIRAYEQWPKSYTTLAGKDVIITKAHVNEPSTPYSVLRTQAEVSVTSTKEISVQTGKGLLIIDALKPAGKKEMSAQEFLLGYSI